MPGLLSLLGLLSGGKKCGIIIEKFILEDVQWGLQTPAWEERHEIFEDYS